MVKTFLVGGLFLFSLILTSNLSAVFAQSTSQTITFDDKTGQNQNLTGQYPTSVIDWGTTQWYHSGPWGQFSTKSASFRNQSQTSGVFTFVTPKRVVSFQAYNGGTVASTVTIACTGNTTKSQSVPVGQVGTISTAWANTCTTVTMTSSNGWNTNFDNIVIDLADATPPTVSVTAPVNNATVTGSAVSLSATAADNNSVAGVQFKVDGANVGAEDTTSPYSVNWNSTLAANGSHSVTAVARDGSNNTATSSAVAVTVNNPPKLIIVSPTSGQTINNTSFNVNYTATGDLTEANHAHFRLDGGGTVMDLDFDGSYTFSNIPAGNHTLVGILARVDHSEITGSDSTVSFVTTTPDTIAPVISITAPAQSATVSGTLNITSTASDNTAVTGVLFKVDGANIGVEDTSSPYSVSWNTTTLANGTHTLTATARDAAANTTTATITVDVFNSNSPDQIGQWGSIMNWPNVAVHTSLLSSGKVLFWDAWDFDPDAKVWDPVTNTFTSVTNQSGYFCSGHVQLADGKILVLGGHSGGGIAGINRSTVFNPSTQAWTPQQNMGTNRWYPSATRLSDGRVLVIGGITSNGAWGSPEIYNPATSGWTTLALNYNEENDDEYPLSFYLPNGKIFTLAATFGNSYMLDVGNQSKTNFGPLPGRLGTATQYRPGKILYAGGGDSKESLHASSKLAWVIDQTTPSPTWRSVTPMQNGRYEFATTISADGKVYMIGGASVVSQVTSNGTTTIERWDPDTEAWATMAPMTDKRMYHSTSLLLPDGKILSAGGGRLSPGPDVLTAQLYSPPYLFKGARPTITNAPASVDYGQTITLDTPDAADISKVTFIALASNTHTIDMNQTYLELNFTKNAGNLSVQAPTDNKLATPGYYMMFILNSNGVPSVSKIMKLNVLVDSQAPVVSITSPADGATVLGSNVTISANATDNIGVASVQFKIDGNDLGAPDTTSPYSVTWDTTTISNGNHNLTALSLDTSGNPATSGGVVVAVNNPADTTPPVISATTATAIVTTSAQITWTTDENADSQVEYGTTTGYGSATTLDTVLVKNHSQNLSGLIPNTLYHYRVKSKDASGNQAVSGDFTFTTLAFNPQTIDFNSATGQDVVLNGEYPTGVINWGTNIWWLSSPWGQFTTKSISFNGSGQTSGSLTFVSPKTLTQMQAFNGGTAASTVTIACTGNTTKSQSVAVNTVATISTGWTNACTTVMITSSNGWNTNFDNLIIQ